MAHLFNSLGSNYSFSFAWKAFMLAILPSGKQSLTVLKNGLEKEFNGKAFFFHKGRDAITYALKLLKLPENSKVITQGFTCYAIEEGIREAQCEPVYADIDPLSLNPTIAELD